MLHRLTLVSLLVHLASSAVSQTIYGASFSSLRWLSLFALVGVGFATWATSRRPPVRMDAVNLRVVVYLGLWCLTVIGADYPLFSAYRLAAHAMIVISGLVLLPAVLRTKDVRLLLPALKIITGVILLVSYFRPAQLNSFDDPNLARGIMGDPNALGHTAALGCILLLHGFINQKGTRWGAMQAALAGLAVILLIRSGARSAVVAFIAGFIPLLIFYRAQLSRYVTIGAAAAIVALLTLPFLSDRINGFLVKEASSQTEETDVTLERMGASRLSLWTREWNDFLERPLLGWGFGLDSGANLSNWNGEFTATGVLQVDPTNDILYTLEGGGVVGLFAYVVMMSLMLKAGFPKAVRAALDAELRRPGYKMVKEAYETQKAFYCVSILLIVMFEFDNTALAAGNFFAALLWIGLGLSAGLHARLMYRTRDLIPNVPVQQSSAVIFNAR
jgi:hypothetical protein